MEDKSLHLQTLEKLQTALENFDPSFMVSNKLFRLALVSEILDTTCMFEQLYCAWSQQLPFGEGPDADVDFEYWKEYSTWRNLVDCAQQNVCINSTTVELGNGMTSDNAPIKRRKNYKKNLNAVFKHTNYPDTQHAIDFFKLIENDKSGMLTFGSIVYNAVQSLILVLNKIHLLLENPSNEQLFVAYYDKQLARFKTELTDWDLRIKNKMKEPIQERRKANALHQLQDDLREALRTSGFLNDLMAGITKYDVNDYREANPGIELSDDQVKEELALNDLHTPSGEPDKMQIAQYIYSHRNQFSSETISSFFSYIIINKEIEKRLSLMGGSVTPTRVETNDCQAPSVVDAIREQTEAMKQTAEVMKEIASRPTTLNNVYPQADSTTNVGCDQKQSEFKTFLPPAGDAQEQLGGQKNEQKSITER